MLNEAKIYIKDSAGNDNETETDVQGHYSINCVDGPVLIVVINNSYAPVLKRMNVENNTICYVNFAMSPPPEPTAAITGHVRDVQGDPLVGVEVVVINDTFLYSNVTYTDGAGHFELGVM